MEKSHTSYELAFRIIFHSALAFAAGFFAVMLFHGEGMKSGSAIIAFIAALVGSIPAAIALTILIPIIRSFIKNLRPRIFALLGCMYFITLLYALPAAALGIFQEDQTSVTGFLIDMFLVSGVFFLCVLVAFFINLRPFFYYFSTTAPGISSYQNILQAIFTHTPKINNNMEVNYEQPPQLHSNRILIKGLITGALILIMLIPTLFINNLITEREARQKEVVKEVSSKWAAAQTLSGPFLSVPYTDSFVNSDGKTIANKIQLLLLANELNVTAKILPEERPRSIYKVLLYRTEISVAGNFKINIPADINAANLDYANAKLCFSLSDFKGVEEELYVNFNNQKLQLTPGMPADSPGDAGLSVPVIINAESAAAGIPFSMQLKIKGSEKLHFMPLSATGKFQIASGWPNPSFDGNSLPSVRNISDKGFSASWSFNRANLPFGTVVKANIINEKAVSFGVSLLQSSDQYSKTMRSVKYAILFIGLTFAFFFIIELMQKKPFHPVQYVLVGLALVIFYSLLLSISEYLFFDYAYFIAAAATITLISFYAKGHFHSWRTAGIFFALLSCLYGFIFILIRLEDTALLVGSIGLFLVLALVMYASRKINWYAPSSAS